MGNGKERRDVAERGWKLLKGREDVVERRTLINTQRKESVRGRLGGSSENEVQKLVMLSPPSLTIPSGAREERRKKQRRKEGRRETHTKRQKNKTKKMKK